MKAPFQFHRSSCVVLGTFNIYIVQPKLLAEMGIFPEEWNGSLLGDLTQPGIRFDSNDSRWTVRPERLAVESKEQSVDCGEPIAKLLTHLKWTPILAVGVNAYFRLPSECETDLPEAFRMPLGTSIGEHQRSCHVAVKEGDLIYNVQISVTDQHLEAMVNCHADFAKLRHTIPQSELNKLACNACSQFFERRTKALDLARKLTIGEFQ